MTDVRLAAELKRVDREIAELQSRLDNRQRMANWIRKEQKRRKDERA